MTILPKKKKGEQQSDSDSDCSGSPAQSPCSHVGVSGHGGSPHPSEDTNYHHSPEGFYHRRYDLSSSSGDSSPELPSITKRSTYRPSSAATSSARSKKPLDISPYYSGYNSSEEYDGSRRPYLDHERERKFEQALKKDRGFIIKKMRPDGACLFRAVADQVYGDQEMHSVVRNHSMDYMLKNADYFSQFVTEEFDHYINRKRSDHCYGNNLEMQAVAEMYNRVIEVYEYSIEPSNIFFAVYKTDNAPIRLSYHGAVHYNSVVDPYKATIGVGLGLAGYKPGLADKTLLREAQGESENVQIEQAMLEDKLRSTDWEATCEAIEEAVARESYLSWLREQERKTGTSRQGLQSTSSACGGSTSLPLHPSLPPPMTTSTAPPSTSLPLPPLPLTSHPITTTTSASIPISSMQLANATINFRGSPLYATAAEVKAVRSYSSSRTSSPATSLRGSRRGTPSPPASFTYRSSSSGGSVRNSPYHSPRDSPRNSHRGSPRNSPHNSAHTSPRNSVHGSPPPSLSLTVGKGNDAQSGTRSPTALTHSSSQVSPPAMMKSLLVNSSEADTLNAGRSSPHTHTTSPHLTVGSTTPTTQQRLATALIPSPHHPSAPLRSQSPPHHSLDFESGRVLDQLPYEYSSFLDLPPAALGLSEWEDDRVLAAVLAASQQEYIDSLKQNSRGAEGF